MIVEVRRGTPLVEPLETAGTPGLGGAGGRTRAPASGGRDSFVPDLLTGEYAGADTQFVLGWKVVIKNDGLPKKDDQTGSVSKSGGAR